MPVDDSQRKAPDSGSRSERFKAWLDQAMYEHHIRYYDAEGASYRWMSRLVGLTAVLMMVAGFCLIVRPQYLHVIEHRAARQAARSLAMGDVNGARSEAEQALAINPVDLMAVRVMARLATLDRSPEELHWRQRVVAIAPTPENKLALADAALRCEQPPSPLAAHLLESLAASESRNGEYQFLAGRLAMTMRQTAQADAHFASAVNLDPTNVNYAVNLATFRLSQAQGFQQTEARARLQQLRSDEVYGVVAMRALIDDRVAEKDPTAALAYSTQLLASPRASLEDRLQHLTLLQQTSSGDFTNQLRTLEQRAMTNALAVAEMSSWMLANNLRAANLAWLKSLPAPMQMQTAVILTLAESYEENGAWQELSDFASQGNWGDMEYLRFAVVSHASAQMGLSDVARSNWGSAVNEATGRLPDLKKLREMAVRCQLRPEEEQLLALIVQDFPEERDAVQALAKIYLQQGNTMALNRLFTQLNAVFPADANYQDNLTAITLLLKNNLPQAENWAMTAYAKTPEKPQVATSYAYTMHLLHRDAEGLEALKKLKPEDLDQPSQALYYGVLLASTGKTAAAMPWLAIAQSKGDSLLPEERQLLAEALGK